MGPGIKETRFKFNLLMTDQLPMLLKFSLLLIQKNVNSNEHAEFLEKISFCSQSNPVI